MSRRRVLTLVGVAALVSGLAAGWVTWVWHLVAGEDPTELGVGGWWDRRA